MKLKQAAKKYCDRFVIAIPVNDDERKMNREIRKAIDAHFTAGAAFERERILGLLRSDEAYEYHDSLSDGASPFNGASPKEIAEWLEAKLKQVQDE